MAGKKLTADRLQKAVQKILNDYRNVTWNNVDGAAKKIAKKARTAVANGSAQFDTRWGEGVYSKGWKVTEREGLWWSSYVVYQSKMPTETHLLEYGHELMPGMPMFNRKHEFLGVNMKSRAQAYPHIGPVASEVPDDFEKETVNAIQRIK